MSPQESLDRPSARGTTRFSETAAAVLLALVTLATFAVFAQLRRPLAHLTGDEGTYYAMAASLARDGDLRFGGPDRQLAESHSGQALTLILQQAGQGTYYSKPILYAVWGAPFVALWGVDGLVAANAVALGAALFLALAYLRRLATRGRAALVLVTFVGAGVLLGQVVWRMTECLQVAMSLSGLILSFGHLRRAPDGVPDRLSRWLDHPSAPWLGALLLAGLATLREPNLLLAALPPLVALLRGDWRRSLALALVIGAALFAMSSLTSSLIGGSNPYRAARSSFDGKSGYPIEGQPSHANFLQHPATQSLDVRPELEPRRSAVAALTFLLGRHAGILVYFPFLIALVPAGLTRPDRLGLAALGCAGALALFFVVWMPDNYFGGEAFLANRYYLAALPLFLIAPTRLPGRALIAVSWGIAALVGGSAIASMLRSPGSDSASQSHAHAGIFRWLPYETTGSPIGGRADRYWSGDFLRFVDPFAAVGLWNFTLTSDSPAAEIVLATYWKGDRPCLLAIAKGGQAELEVTDWRSSRRYPLPHLDNGAEARGLVWIEPAPPWRRHSFWWGSLAEIYNVRALRLAVVPKGPAPATVRFRYLGQGTELKERAAAELLAGALPADAAAGGTTRVRLRLRNTGDSTWEPLSALPTRLAFRVVDPTGTPLLEGRSDLPHKVRPGEELDQEIEIGWPSRPGPCRVTIDLIREDLAWFSEANGVPLLEGDVLLSP